jgi:hypothetical protein
VTVTTGGAVDPAWSKSSNELFYIGPGAGRGPVVYAMPFTVSGTSFVPGKPVALFSPSNLLGGGTTVRATYDVSRDGRFLMNQPIPEAAQARASRTNPSSLRFVLNWTQGIQQLLNPSSQ